MSEFLLIAGACVAALMAWGVLTDNKIARVLRLDSWARVEFDFRNYNLLRDRGLSHKAATRELDRMWNERT